jgi:hypothetical protein
MDGMRDFVTQRSGQLLGVLYKVQQRVHDIDVPTGRREGIRLTFVDKEEFKSVRIARLRNASGEPVRNHGGLFHCISKSEAKNKGRLELKAAIREIPREHNAWGSTVRMVAANSGTVRPHAQEVCSSPDTVLEFKSRLVGEPTRNAIRLG